MTVLFYLFVPVGLLCVGFFVYAIIPTYYNKLISKQVIRKTKQSKEILLSFDDGPDQCYTPLLLDLLRQENVQATFFVVAENARKNPELIKRMQQENHTVGLHSWEHKNAMTYGYGYTKQDFAQSIAVLKSMGITPRFYRPPWGHTNLFSKHFIRKHQLKMVQWNIMAQDWKQAEKTESIAAKLLVRTKKHPIICLHDAGENSGGAKDAPLKTIDALKLAIPMLKAKGYQFISLERSFS